MSSKTTEPLEGNYFVAVYPPFSCWKEHYLTEFGRKLDVPSSPNSNVPFGLYVHLPFCVERCMYCYYLSYAKQSTHQLIDQYLDALIKELSIYHEKPYFADHHLDFVYFGGGTPSVLSVEQIRKLVSTIKTIFPWTAVQEITFECAPKTVTESKLKTLKEAGITRISLGIQQLNDEVLKKNGRVHLVSDIKRAYTQIQRIGFEIVNVDLIVGLLQQSDSSFIESLNEVIKMNSDGVTIYQLEIPFNTPLSRKYHEGTLDDSLATWDTKRARLARGFAQLEESGYQLRSAYTAVRDSRYEKFVYQDAQYHGSDLLGIGTSAFSYIDGIHHQNLSSLELYLERLDHGQLPLGRAYILTDEERLIREFILQLKLGKVNGNYFKQKFGIDVFKHFSKVINHYINQGFLVRGKHELRLTRDGLLQVDSMLPAFYLPEHQAVRYS